MRLSLLSLALLLSINSAWAQKKPLDHTVYDSWQAVGTTLLSPIGSVLAYEVNPQEGDGTLTIRN